MNKENKSAAGLRRSAIAERIKLREEWSALKGVEEENIIAPRKPLGQAHNVVRTRTKKKVVGNTKRNVTDLIQIPPCSDVLRGVVSLVDIGDSRLALALRAALAALGATVVPEWTPLITHLVYQDGGCRKTRARARALACRVVSPLWVEACAASSRRLPERAFPAAARASDLPSPATLRCMLKKAERENIPLMELLADSNGEEKPLRLRISDSSEHDSSKDTSADTTHDSSRDITDPVSRVNTAPRRAVPGKPSPAGTSRRKLFTHKDPDVLRKSSGDDTEAESMVAPKRMQPKKLTQAEKRNLAAAERLARRLANTGATNTCATGRPDKNRPRIVLTGMSRAERKIVCEAIRKLNGKIQSTVDHRTTHVVLGSCRDDIDPAALTHRIPECIPKARTVNALLGAVRGCRVVHAQWAVESAGEGRWRHHTVYEVPHLKKVSMKARSERSLLGATRSQYAYNVFHGMKVLVDAACGPRQHLVDLLRLCGADVCEEGRPDVDLTVGEEEGQVEAKWVFDSAAAGRMRSIRRYRQLNVQARTEALSQMSQVP